MDETPQILSCRCCIVGGGPAGMMLGFLLARAGVDTIKHADFLRDFRGDPSLDPRSDWAAIRHCGRVAIVARPQAVNIC